jgi:integrase
MNRKAKGDGSITRLPSGKWLAKFPTGKNSKGSTRYQTKTCATKSEARRWQQSMIGLRERQMLVSGPRQTLRQYAAEILLNRNDRIADRTRDGYYRNLEKHVFPVFGSRPLPEIGAQELEMFFSRLRSTHSASTVNNVRIALSKVYTTALRHGTAIVNPVRQTQKAKRGEFEPTQVNLPWSIDEALEAKKAASGTSMEAILLLASATGMRRGELLGLRWGDLDFDSHTVSIERTIHRESILQPDGSRIGRIVVAPPKTASSRRVNQLSEPLIDVLVRHQMEQAIVRSLADDDWENSDYVFTNDRGNPLDESKFSKRWSRFLRENGLRRIRFHDVRHSFATILIEEDSGNLASVSKALGHSSIGITMDIYAKTARIDTQATSRMSELLFPEAGKVTSIQVPVPSRDDATALRYWRAG